MFDPDFCTRYIVERTKGNWVKGRFEMGKPKRLNYFGPVQPANEKDLQQIPEGDRLKSVVKFMVAPPRTIYLSDIQPEAGSTDIVVCDKVIYRGAIYKIIGVKNWDENGYTRAFGHVIGRVKGNG
jgi:hypothetical protein